MSTDFLLEEYKIKWNYLLHLEKKWDSVLKWYATVVGALISLVLGLTSLEISPMVNSLQIPVLAFTVVYSVFVCLYILTQKRGYRKYHKRIVEIEREQLGEQVHPVYLKERWLSTFRIYLGFPALIGGGLSALLVFAISNSFGWSILAGSLFTIAIIGLSFTKTFY